MEAIILAGGKGTRLASIVNDVPKPMALIDDVPFITYLLQMLLENNATRVIMSIGYKGELIERYYGNSYSNMQISYCREDAPLGTGGAIKSALSICTQENVLVVNGDTYFDIDLSGFFKFHCKHNADISIALKKMSDYDRYGTIVLAGHDMISFREKEYTKCGYINGGVYLVKNTVFNYFHYPDKFSFEQFMQDNVKGMRICAFPSVGHFIDIGIPKDYEAAQKLLPQWTRL